jgi:dihydropteroate synthase
MDLPSPAPDARVYLEPPPLGVAGNWTVWTREAGRIATHAAPRDAIAAWAGRRPDAAVRRIADLLARIDAPLPLPFDPQTERPLLMGIVNATPDSFSDGGQHDDPARAIAHGEKLAAEGADLLDVGGESTRPGASPVDPREERVRVVPVVRGLVRAGRRVSIDTRNAPVMRAALDEGACMVNDVSALTHDPESLALVRDRRVPVVLMHMQGEPATMNRAPRYARACLDVFDWLEARIADCVAAGIARERILVDPGLGFGKREAHNIDVLKHLALLCGLGAPVVLGASRKGLTAAINKGWPAPERGPASIVAAVHALDGGAKVLRVHDVAATRQAVMLWRALREAP